MTIQLIDVVIGLFFTIVGGIIGVLGYRQTRKKNLTDSITKTVTHDTKIDIKLDNIAKNVEEIRLDNKEFSKLVTKLTERISTLETTVGYIIQRVETLEKLEYKDK